MPTPGSLAVVRVNRAALEGRYRPFQAAGLVQRVGVDGNLGETKSRSERRAAWQEIGRGFLGEARGGMEVPGILGGFRRVLVPV